MKPVITLFVTLALHTAALAANSVFYTTSPVPQELQSRILKAIEEKCPTVKNGSLSEYESTENMVSVDQGIRDYLYASLFLYTFLVGTKPHLALVTVESANYDITNPGVDRYQVLKVTGDEWVPCQ